MKSVRYSLIYKFFVSQILFGNFREGDPLPSIEELTKAYHAPSQTVYNAYLQLQKDGYVRLSPGRRTTVAYRATPEECAQAQRDYYLARREAILGLNQSLRVLFLPLLREGSLRLGRPEMRQVREMALWLERGDFYLSFFCGRAMLLALKNRLALHLLNDAIAFYQFPHALLRGREGARAPVPFPDLSRRVVDACDRGDREALFQLYTEVEAVVNRALEAFLTPEEPGAGREQIPFQWKVYRDHPQLCYSVAAQILSQVYLARAYAPGDTLPSYGALAEAHSISFSTARRTVELLELLGVAATSRGAGTRVTAPEPDPDRMRRPRAARVLAALRDTLQILSICFDSAVEHAPPGTADPGPLLGRTGAAGGLSALVLGMDGLFQDRAGFQGIWDKLREALLLGLPLLEAEATARPDAAGALGAYPDELARSLEAGDTAAFHRSLKALLETAADLAGTLPEPAV